jgi:hypothetical protein
MGRRGHGSCCGEERAGVGRKDIAELARVSLPTVDRWKARYAGSSKLDGVRCMSLLMLVAQCERQAVRPRTQDARGHQRS